MSFDSLNKVSSFNKTFVCTGVKPCKALTKKLYIKIALLKINTIKVCDLKLTSCWRFKILSIFYNLIIIEVKTCYAVVALRLMLLTISHFLYTEKVLMYVTGSMLKIIVKLLILSFIRDVLVKYTMSEDTTKREISTLLNLSAKSLENPNHLSFM